MALMGLIYRDALFPRRAFRDTFTSLLEQVGDKLACRITVELLALAHDRGCEAELAEYLEEDLRQQRTPDTRTLRELFGPSDYTLPIVRVQADLASYNTLASNAAPIVESGQSLLA